MKYTHNVGAKGETASSSEEGFPPKETAVLKEDFPKLGTALA